MMARKKKILENNNKNIPLRFIIHMILKLIKIFVRRKHAIAIMKYILQVSTIKMITYTAPVYIVTPAL